MLEPTLRFSDRAENYAKYRPGYPPELIAILRQECDLSPSHTVADIGSGTGILTKLFLDLGNAVFAVEPNAAMRAAAESWLEDRPNFTSVDATAENTTLQPGSVDFVVAGTAFHWFDAVATRQEFARILYTGGWVALVWNRRRPASSPIQTDYEQLMTLHAAEYGRATHRRVDAAALTSFFAPNTCIVRHMANYQDLDLESLRGRVLSSSSAPLPGQPGHEALMNGLRDLFERYNEDGRVRFDYTTELTFGHLT